MSFHFIGNHLNRLTFLSMIIAAVVTLNVFPPGEYLNRLIGPFEDDYQSSDADSFRIAKTGYAF